MEFLGLTSAEAQSRLKQYGFNELEAAHQTSIFYLLGSVFREPIFILLVVGAILYFIIGSTNEALMLTFFVCVIASITGFQEYKSERALRALKNLSSPRAFVIRDGVGKRIAGRQVVIDDIIVVKEGDLVPADATLVSEDNLLIDESILTGESFPVSKKTALPDQIYCRPGGGDLPFIYSGTYVVQGRGMAKVVAMAMNTEVGKIGKTLKGIKTEKTFLQKETDKFVRFFAITGIILCIIVAIIYGVTRADWVNGLLVGITLAMAILPEEFPVVLTVFLALGAWRISRENVLTRHVPAIETLGSATVLCVDKTGTITQNKMHVDRIYVADDVFETSALEANAIFPEQFHQLVEYSMLASQRDPFDPMEKAIKTFAEKYLEHTEHIHNDWQLVHQYPLSKELLAISLVWHSQNNKEYVIAAKGAPEAIFDLCHLPQEKIKFLTDQILSMANDGLRVLGVAKASMKKTELPEIQHDFNFEFIGLLGLSDPIRPSVSDAIKECFEAGIKVMMLTGDYAGTAIKIAKQIGLVNVENVITGSELSVMSDEELQKKIKNVSIFARILPEQKLRIVQSLQKNHEIIAMTGDGVNDAPALKAANIGIAMGGRGTDVAREAAELVLVDDDFSSIVSAVKLGRRIFDNIKKAVIYLIAAHIPIIGLTLLPLIFGWPLILLPVHIVFLELIIDPACSIVFEAEPAEEDIMQRKPRSPSAGLFEKQTVFLGLFQGIGVMLVTMVLYLLCREFVSSYDAVRAMTFTVLVLANLMLILTNKSRQISLLKSISKPNSAFWWVIGGAMSVFGIVLYTPFLQRLFYFVQIRFLDLIICIIFGIICLIYLELIKKVFVR